MTAQIGDVADVIQRKMLFELQKEGFKFRIKGECKFLSGLIIPQF